MAEGGIVETSTDQMLQDVRKALLTMPHLRKVNTLRFGDQMSVEILCLINNLLPELEVLETQCQNNAFSTYHGELVHFKRVNHLIMHISGVGTRPTSVPISFERLEHLILNGYSCESKIWTEFIIQNKHLRTLELMPGLCIWDNENIDHNLMKFAAELSELTAFFVYGDFISSPNKMIQFVDGCKNLIKLHLRFLYRSNEIRESFATALSSAWNVTQIQIDERRNDMIFERLT